MLLRHSVCSFKIQDLILGPNEEWLTQVSGLERVGVGRVHLAGPLVLSALQAGRVVLGHFLPPPAWQTLTHSGLACGWERGSGQEEDVVGSLKNKL